MAERISRDSEESEPYQHRRYSDDATDLAASMSSAVNDRIFDARTNSFRERLGLASIGRRSLGIFFLLVTVFLWTLSNFLASVSLPILCRLSVLTRIPVPFLR